LQTGAAAESERRQNQTESAAKLDEAAPGGKTGPPLPGGPVSGLPRVRCPETGRDSGRRRETGQGPARARKRCDGLRTDRDALAKRIDSLGRLAALEGYLGAT